MLSLKIFNNKALFAILLLAFLLRIAGINYGLPLWLFDDEPPFTLAALKMLELKTLLPALHQTEFENILYYPPYLAYLYLLPFALVIALKFLFFKGTTALFVPYLASDLSQFFIIARLINIILGTISIFLIYKIAENIFRNAAAALFAGFFLATSLIHVALSITGRHWLAAAFFFSLVLFFLSRSPLNWKKRYFWATFSAGLGVGFTTINGLLAVFIACWYIFYEKRPILNLLKEKFFYFLCALFVLLLILSYALYPGGLGFKADLTAKAAKTIWGVIASPFYFAKTITLSEPIFILFAVLGLIFSFKKTRNFFWSSVIFIYIYSAVFYLIFRFEPRFLLGLLPLFALFAGYGFHLLQKSTASSILAKALLVLLFIPLISVLRLDLLAIRNDSRVLARNWTEENLPSGTKVLVLARLTRLATNKEAVKEQASLDPASLRKADFAEAEFKENPHGYKSFHALNLYNLNDEEFYKNIAGYIRQNKYQYLIISPGYSHSQYFKDVTGDGRPLQSFGSDQGKHSLAESQFLDNPWRLFALKELGPPVNIYKLSD